MIVDFERVTTGDFSSAPAAVLDQIDMQHENIWALFADVKGPLWNDALEGKPG
jgi:hypothetical protein